MATRDIAPRAANYVTTAMGMGTGDGGIGGSRVVRYNDYIVEEHRGIGGNIISRLDHGAFVGLIYSLLVFS